MLISVLYVGTDAPPDWNKIDAHARMGVLSFDEFKEFFSSHPGEVYAVPEVQDRDEAAWQEWLLRNNLRAPYSNGRIERCRGRSKK